MKQKVFSLLSLIAMVLCSQFVRAERVAPTLPEVSLESGGTYYLYNVEAESFLGYAKNSGYEMGINEDPVPVEIILKNNGAYTLRITSITNGYIYSYDNYCRTNNSSYGGNSQYSYWNVTGSESGAYLIQRSPLNKTYYNADQYLGWQGDNATSVYANRPITDGVQWKLIPADATGNRYAASLKLFKALNMADAFVENGWNIDYYLDLFDDRATADIDEMTQGAYSLRNGLNMSAGYQAPYWNEYPILWQTSEGAFGDDYDKTWVLPNNSHTSGNYFQRRLYGGRSSQITATVKNDELSTFVYTISGDQSTTLVEVYIDGVQVRSLINEQTDQYVHGNGGNSLGGVRYFEELEPGVHKITFRYTNTSSSSYYYYEIRDVGIMKSPQITISLLEPGSLGTEVLYNTDHIKNVRRLKVIGKMNADDWSKVKMMHYLQDLDLSEAEFTEIPANQFCCEHDTASWFLHSIKLPEGLRTIWDKAFYYSFIEHMEFPSTVNKVGKSSFTESHLKELILPDNLTDIYYDSNTNYTTNRRDYEAPFSEMYWLEKLVCPKNLTNIPRLAFYQNYFCKEVTLPEKLQVVSERAFYNNQNMSTEFPEGLTEIDEYAFYHCYKANFSELPQSLTYIGRYAFWNCNGIKKLVIPNNVTTIGERAFESCHGLTDAEVSVGVYNMSNSVFSDCTSLQTLRLNSPTVVSYNTNSYSYPVDASMIKNVTLIVPNHIVTSYKLDNYWYNFKSIEGFSTAEIQDWIISNPLVLNRDRFEGTPNIRICGSKDRKPSLKINGDAAMTINDLVFYGYYADHYFNYPGQILSNCSNITINGNVETRLWTRANYWYFFSLPFDIKVSEIMHETAGVQKAVRYYDGANRAEVGRTGSWKNYDADDVIPAGTGFIIQTNVDTWNRFYALDNDSKQQCVKNVEFVKTLAVNDSDNPSNKGWNLVGNPWQCYFNDHLLNFTGPITVWNVSNKTYSAYSIIDDDYAISPNEAFFVQCPDAQHNTIGFPTIGRQLNDVIEIQNGGGTVMAPAPVLMLANQRQLVNILISDGETEDRTRVVLNEQASIRYETNCDAGKLMSMDNSVPQIYSIDAAGNRYAINERPMETGVVSLGFYAAADGTYTLSLGRCDAENVILIDYETGTEQLLTEGYTFNAAAGYNDDRFALKFGAGTTGMASVKNDETNDATYYNTAGQIVPADTKGIVIADGEKFVNE